MTKVRFVATRRVELALGDELFDVRLGFGGDRARRERELLALEALVEGGRARVLLDAAGEADVRRERLVQVLQLAELLHEIADLRDGVGGGGDGGGGGGGGDGDGGMGSIVT